MTAADHGANRQVRDDDIVAEVQFGLVKDAPSARSPAAAIEGIAQDAAESRARVGMAGCRSRTREQLAVNKFGDEVIGHVQQIVVGGLRRRANWLRHHPQEYLAPAPGGWRGLLDRRGFSEGG